MLRRSQLCAASDSFTERARIAAYRHTLDAIRANSFSADASARAANNSGAVTIALNAQASGYAADCEPWRS